jgi:phage FluMu protein Com
MARSEYIGDTCPFCKKVWRSEDFERTGTEEADYFNPEEGVMYVGQYWVIRCKLCGKSGRFLHSGRPKTKEDK